MWNWLTNPNEPYTWGFIFRVVLKAITLFIVFNFLFAWLQPMDFISRLSLYNLLFEGRERLPYAGVDSSQSYSINIDSIPAMLATHKISRPKSEDEFRVIILGNSGLWGFRLPPYQSIAPQINEMNYLLADNRRVVAYNLAYPFPLTIRDLLFLDEAMRYQPDMIIWVVSMASFYLPIQYDTYSKLVVENLEDIRRMIDQYGLAINENDERFNNLSFYQQTIIGQIPDLASMLRLQLYGAMWSSTHIDHTFLSDYLPTPNDIRASASWWVDLAPNVHFNEQDLFFNVLDVGYNIVGDIPLIIVNQPMFIATGENSDVRYNTDYPRWEFDSYSELISRLSIQNEWLYCNLWNDIPSELFTDTPFHINAQGTHELGRILGEMITDYMEFGYLGRECE